MKVLFLARRFYPDIGGVETHVHEVSKLLINKGHKVTVITQSPGKETEVDGIKIIRIPETPKNKSEKLFIWKWFWNNRELIKSSKIIHAHDVYFWYMPIRFIFPNKLSFITFHGFEKFPVSKKEIFIRQISAKLADGNIAVGDFIEKYFKTKPDFVTYGGVNVPKKLSEPKNHNTILFIGRLEKDTNILSFAKTIQILNKKNKKLKFLIVGEGIYRESLMKEFRVQKATRDLAKYYDQIDFVFSSSYLSILNALAHKKVVFSLFDNELKRDYLKMSIFSKFIVIADSPEKLAEKISYFLTFPREAEKFKKHGFEFAKNQNWENVVNCYIKLWKK